MQVIGRHYSVVCGGFLTLMLLAGGWRMACAQTQEDLEYSAALSSSYIRLSRSGRIDESVEVAQRFAAHLEARFPARDHFRGSMFVAEAFGMQGKYKESIEKWQQTLERFEGYVPRTPEEQRLANIVVGDCLRSIGFNYGRLGQPAEALKYYQKMADYWARSTIPEARFQWARSQVAVSDGYRVLGDKLKASQAVASAITVLDPLARTEQPPGFVTHELCLALSIAGDIDRALDRYDLAEGKLRRALLLRVAENGWEHIDTAIILDALVRLYGSQARWKEAEYFCRLALNAHEKSAPGHIEITNVQIRLALVYNGLNRQPEAEALLRSVVARLEREFGADNTRTLGARHELAKILWMQDKHGEAEPILRRNMATEEMLYGKDSTNLVDALILLGMVLTNSQRAAEALPLFDRILAIHEQSPLGTQDISSLRIARSHALWDTGKREAAVAELDLGLEQYELLRAFSSGAERERAEMFVNLNSAYLAAIQWRAELHDVPRLFATIEQSKARSFLDELKLKGVDLLAGLSAAERRELAAQENELRQQLSAAERRFQALPGLGPSPTAEARQERQQAAREMQRASDQLYEFLTELRSTSPIYRQLLQSKTGGASLAQVQQLLADDELLLTYSIGTVNSYVVCVRRDRAEFHPIEVAESLARTLGVEPGFLTNSDLVQILLDQKTGLLGMISKAQRRQEDPTSQLAALWAVLIPAAERAKLVEGKLKRLVVIPDGPLALLPFEALVVKNEGEPQYLLDVGPPIAYAPSAAVLLNLVERAPAAAENLKLFTLGDPTYAPVAAGDSLDRSLGVSRAADQFRATLARLPFTGLESAWVQQNLEKIGFVTAKVTGPQATEGAIRRLAPGQQVIHLACHGMADRSYGNFFGALAVAPGKPGDPRDDGSLSMSEIYELDLTGCELAILSACETNYGPQQQGEGVWALSRGFLVAGSRRVIASNWVVDDQAGATLVSLFSSYLSKAGKDTAARDYAAALHKAKKDVRQDPKWQHPFYWSSLVLVGPK